MSKNKLAPSSDYFLRFDKKIVFSTPSGKPYRAFASLVDKKGNLVAPIGINVDDLVEFSRFVNVAKNTETKYDPCRLFKAGDIVEPCSVNGRWCSHVWEDRSGIHYEVAKEEDPLTAHMELKDPDSPHPFLVHAAFFKLVTPVEEQERYVVIHNKNEKHFDVCWKDDDEPDGRTGRVRCRVTYRYHQPPMTYTEEEAKAAAEAECARLKAEYRKEMKK